MGRAAASRATLHILRAFTVGAFLGSEHGPPAAWDYVVCYSGPKKEKSGRFERSTEPNGTSGLCSAINVGVPSPGIAVVECNVKC